MPDFLQSILANGLTPASFAACFAAAIALGFLVAGAYMFRSHYSKSMVITLTLLPCLVQLIIMLVGGNLGAGVAVAGAFGLVRFRSATGTARDITYIFLAMALGLATGMGYIGVAVTSAIAICLLLTALTASPFGEKGSSARELRITIPEQLDYCGLFDDIFSKYTKKASLVGVRTINMGSLYRLDYQVTITSELLEKEMIDAIRCRNGNLEIVCSKSGMATDML